MNSLYLRIADPRAAEPGWTEVTDGPFPFDRSVWRGDEVSRTASRCVILRRDPDFGGWELKNGAPGRVVILHDGRHRYELITDMSLALGSRRWIGTLTDAFTFEIRSVRPQEAVHVAGSELLDDDADFEDLDTTRPRDLVTRACVALDRNPPMRRALAYLWREQLEHTPDVAADVDTATVAQALGESNKTITNWRAELGKSVYGRYGRQNAIRDLVIRHRLLTLADVAEADRFAAELRRRAS